MLSLLRVDMYRFLKSKQFLIALIASVAVAILLPIICFSFEEIVKSLVGASADEPASGSSFLAKDFAFINFGFYFPIYISGQFLMYMYNFEFILVVILFSIAITRDFAFGTIRNKIITGKSRTEIYLSLFITLYVFMVGIALVSSLTGFAVACMFFKFAAEGEELIGYVGNFCLSMVFMFLSYFFICSFMCFFAVGLTKTPLSIIFTLLLAFLGYLIGSLSPAIISLLQVFAGENDVQIYIDLITFLNVMNVFGETAAMNFTGFKIYEIIGYTLWPISFGALFTGFGILIFNKRNLK
ncbi:MAG: hypothetical protein IJM36_00160 [Acholeplasmatales bacterium]|nr:hypothetical protein [Acholeplasmatales bacterium]